MRAGVGQFKQYVIYTLLVVCLLGGIVYIYRNRIANEFGRLGVEHTNQMLQPSGWRVAVGSFRLISPTEIEISKLGLIAPDRDRPACSLDQVHIRFANPMSVGGNEDQWVDQIAFDRSLLKIDTSQASSDDLERMVEFLRSLPQNNMRLPEFRIRDAVCQIADGESAYPVTIRNIQVQSGLPSRTGSPDSTLTTIRCESGNFRQALVKLNRQSLRDWSVAAQIDDFRLDDSLLSLLELVSATEQVEGITHLGGRVDVSLQGAIRDGQIAPEQCSLSATVEDLSIGHRDLSFPITHGRGRVELLYNSIRVQRFVAQLGDGDCEIDYFQDALSSPNNWDVSGRLNNVRIDERLQSVLPPVGKKFILDFAPNGLISLGFRYGRKNDADVKSCRVQIQDLSTSFHRFPFQLEHCVGTGYWEGSECGFDVQALENGHVVSVLGKIQDPGPSSTFDIRFSCDELTIEDKLFEALRVYPTVFAQIRACKPRGTFGVSGRFLRTSPEQTPALSYDVELKQCSVRHDHFDFPIRNVNGRFEVRGQNIKFDQIVGENLSSSIVCNGSWSLDDGLALRFLGSRVVLDEQLRYALPAVFKDVWDSVRPTGQIPLARVDLSLPTGAKDLDVDIVLDARRTPDGNENQLAITSTAFPYEIRNIAGLIEVADNRISLKEMSGRHGKSWLSCNGIGQYSNQGWQIHLVNILSGSLPVDADLLSALPKELRSSVERIKFDGNINVSGSLSMGSEVKAPDVLASNLEIGSPAVAPVSFITLGVAASTEGPLANARAATSSIDWDLRLDTDDARMLLGLELSNIHGMLQLRGRSNDEFAFSEGQIQLDSLQVLGMQVTNIEGPIWIDSTHVGVGLFAVPEGSQANQKSLTGKLFGGQLNLDAKSWTERVEKFYLQTTLDLASLKSAAATLAPSLDSVDGTGQVLLRLSGECDSMDSFSGEGRVNMYNARIYELPVLLATLKQLRRFNEDKSAFDSCNIDFGISGKKATISTIKLQGEPISLIGNGQVDFERNIDLNFFTVAGRNSFYVPVLTEIYEASSQNILWISVDGTLDNPQTHRKILPGVNEGLKELFQAPSRNP